MISNFIIEDASKISFSCLLTNMLSIRLILLDKRVGSVIVGRNPELKCLRDMHCDVHYCLMGVDLC